MALRTSSVGSQAPSSAAAVPQARGDRGRGRLTRSLLPHGPFALLLAAYVWLGLGYAFATPAWENPDEPAHYNFVADLVRTGQLPVMEPGAWDQSLLERLTATQFNPPERLDTIRYEAWQPPLYYLLAVPAYVLPHTEAGRIRALRVFDVALGGLTVLAAYLAAREVLVRRPL